MPGLIVILLQVAQAILGLQFAPASKDRFRIESVREQARASRPDVRADVRHAAHRQSG